jgi:GNAT superfamily N-acetyltransferase
VRIEYSKSAVNTEAFALIAEGWNDLVQEGHTPWGVGVCPVRANSEVLYAIAKESDVVGCLVWEHDVVSGQATVTLAFVEPSSRKRGVFKALLAALIARYKDAPCTRIALAVEAENKVGQAALRHTGVQPATILYDIPL